MATLPSLVRSAKQKGRYINSHYHSGVNMAILNVCSLKQSVNYVGTEWGMLAKLVSLVLMTVIPTVSSVSDFEFDT